MAVSTCCTWGMCATFKRLGSWATFWWWRSTAMPRCGRPDHRLHRPLRRLRNGFWGHTGPARGAGTCRRHRPDPPRQNPSRRAPTLPRQHRTLPPIPPLTACTASVPIGRFPQILYRSQFTIHSQRTALSAIGSRVLPGSCQPKPGPKAAPLITQASV